MLIRLQILKIQIILLRGKFNNFQPKNGWKCHKTQNMPLPWQQMSKRLNLFILFMCTPRLFTSQVIRRRSDYIIGFVTPAIDPNKSRKLTRLIAPAHNTRGKVWMKNNIHGFTDDNCLSVKPCMFFYSNFAACIVCRRDKPCEFPRFVWTDCWGNKSYYVINSPANKQNLFFDLCQLYWKIA